MSPFSALSSVHVWLHGSPHPLLVLPRRAPPCHRHLRFSVCRLNMPRERQSAANSFLCFCVSRCCFVLRIVLASGCWSFLFDPHPVFVPINGKPSSTCPFCSNQRETLFNLSDTAWPGIAHIKPGNLHIPCREVASETFFRERITLPRTNKTQSHRCSRMTYPSCNRSVG